MSKLEELKQTYVKDIQQLSTKSRFGFFSIPPSASAAIPDHSNLPKKKDENGKVITEARNIFGGLNASGMLKKSFFNYETSVYQGDPYMDPGKVQRKKTLEQTKNLTQRDVYKPASLAKTPSPKASYQHIGEKQASKCVKDFVDENGKVKSEPRNVFSSSLPNIQRLKLKQFKHVSEPYEAHLKQKREQLKKTIALRGEIPFKGSSPRNCQFYTYRQTYGTTQNCQSPMKTHTKSTSNMQHQAKFRPSNCKKYETFSYPEYIPGGLKPKSLTARVEGKQTFRLIAPSTNSKPCPSITGIKTNLLRSIR